MLQEQRLMGKRMGHLFRFKFQGDISCIKGYLFVHIKQNYACYSEGFYDDDLVSPGCRLAICLYRLARGDYLFTISEMTGYGVATVCQIVLEVCAAIVKHLCIMF